MMTEMEDVRLAHMRGAGLVPLIDAPIRYRAPVCCATKTIASAKKSMAAHDNAGTAVAMAAGARVSTTAPRSLRGFVSVMKSGSPKLKVVLAGAADVSAIERWHVCVSPGANAGCPGRPATIQDM